jgi:hypothetical protein
VATARHKHVLRKQPTLPRRLVQVAVPVAAVATMAASAVALEAPAEPTTQTAGTTHTARPSPSPDPVSVRMEPLSRSAERVRLKPRPEPPPEVVDHEFTTTRLNVWTEPTESSRLLDVLDPGTKVAVSGEVRGPWAEIVVDKESRWVHAAYLAERKPKPEPVETTSPTPTPRQSPSESPTEQVQGLSTAPCASGSDVESGLVPNAVAVHRAVCAVFPQVKTYGGYRDDGSEHSDGTSIDIMVYSDSDLGDQIASWVRSHAGALHVREVIWAQHIWTVERSSEGWRPMEDRGSVTANHYDHVHVRVY